MTRQQPTPPHRIDGIVRSLPRRRKTMDRYVIPLVALGLLLGGPRLAPAGTRLPSCMHQPSPRALLPVEVAPFQVRTEGALVWVVLAYHNPTAMPVRLGLQPWRNACTQLLDDGHHTYTLLQAIGIGDGEDPRDWLTVAPEGRATVVLIFRAEDPTGPPPTRYTLRSAHRARQDPATADTAFMVVLGNLSAQMGARE